MDLGVCICGRNGDALLDGRARPGRGFGMQVRQRPNEYERILIGALSGHFGAQGTHGPGTTLGPQTVMEFGSMIVEAREV